MTSKDPLEPLFGLIKADSTELAHNPLLETRLMNQLQNQLRPRPWKKVAIVLAAFLGLVLAGGGIAAASGYNPLNLFRFVAVDGNGNAVDFNVTKQVDNGDGTVTFTGTTSGQAGEIRVTVVPDEPKK